MSFGPSERERESERGRHLHNRRRDVIFAHTQRGEIFAGLTRRIGSTGAGRSACFRLPFEMVGVCFLGQDSSFLFYVMADKRWRGAIWKVDSGFVCITQ